MKPKTVTTFSALVTAAFAFYVYSFPPVLEKNNESSDTIYMNYKEPMSKLPVALIHDMVDNYNNNQLKIINNNMKIDDARSNWFDLETLKKFLYHIEQKAKNNTDRPISSENLGVRFYYGSYPIIDSWDNPNYIGLLNDFSKKIPEAKKYGKHHSLIMIPTRKEGALNIDFNPEDPDTYTKSLKDLEPYSRKTEKSIINKVSSSSEMMMSALNHGSLIPPRTRSGAEGF